MDKDHGMHENSAGEDAISGTNHNAGMNSCLPADHTDAIASGIKQNVFDYIKRSRTLPALLKSQDVSGAVREIISACYNDAVGAGAPHGASVGVLATSILHYMLTVSMITSQRKTTYRGVEIDIAIPDAATIGSDPQRALVIYVAMTDDRNVICRDLESILAVHPVHANVWAVLSEDVSRDFMCDDSNDPGKTHAGRLGAVRCFAISRDGGSFAGELFSAIGRFVSQNAGGQNSGRLRMAGSITGI